MSQEVATSLTCPHCGNPVPVAEGMRIVRCPVCDTRSLVSGDRGIRRWQVLRQVGREQALQATQGFFKGMKKAPDLRQKARVEEMFLVYLPYWRVSAFVAGWTFGRRKSQDDGTRPAEVAFEKELSWSDAAVDVGEFGVHRVPLEEKELEPYDAERLHAEGLVFEPVESATEAVKEAEAMFREQSRASFLSSRFFERFHSLRLRLALVYYPLWVARYAYKNRSYQVVVDGARGGVLYGKAPGNILYRALALVAGMAAGNFILVNGTIIAGWLVRNSSNDDSFVALLIPGAIGLALILAGYRAFRYGEEVEEMQKAARKAQPRAAGLLDSLGVDLEAIESLKQSLET